MGPTAAEATHGDKRVARFQERRVRLGLLGNEYGMSLSHSANEINCGRQLSRVVHRACVSVSASASAIGRGGAGDMS